MKKILISLIVILFACVSMVSAQTVTTYTYSGKVSVTFSWTHAQDANFDHYELKLLRLAADNTVLEEFTYGTSNLSISVIRPRAGTYEARVRAVNRAGDGSFLFSEWASSLGPDARLQDGTIGPWKLRWKLSPPVLMGPITDD